MLGIHHHRSHQSRRYTFVLVLCTDKLRIQDKPKKFNLANRDEMVLEPWYFAFNCYRK
jgi:hypothetical protein